MYLNTTTSFSTAALREEILSLFSPMKILTCLIVIIWVFFSLKRSYLSNSTRLVFRSRNIKKTITATIKMPLWTVLLKTVFLRMLIKSVVAAALVIIKCLHYCKWNSIKTLASNCSINNSESFISTEAVNKAFGSRNLLWSSTFSILWFIVEY